MEAAVYTRYGPPEVTMLNHCNFVDGQQSGSDQSNVLALALLQVARHPPKNYYETAEDSNAVRANAQIKKLLHRVQYHF